MRTTLWFSMKAKRRETRPRQRKDKRMRKSERKPERKIQYLKTLHSKSLGTKYQLGLTTMTWTAMTTRCWTQWLPGRKHQRRFSGDLSPRNCNFDKTASTESSILSLFQTLEFLNQRSKNVVQQLITILMSSFEKLVVMLLSTMFWKVHCQRLFLSYQRIRLNIQLAKHRLCAVSINFFKKRVTNQQCFRTIFNTIFLFGKLLHYWLFRMYSVFKLHAKRPFYPKKTVTYINPACGCSNKRMNLFTLKSALHYKLIRNTATYFYNKARILELDST